MSAGTIEEKSDGGPWLHAWYDPVAGLKTFTQCIKLADLTGDGDYRLVVADHERRLKVFKGTSVASTHALLDVPSGLACFYPEVALSQSEVSAWEEFSSGKADVAALATNLTNIRDKGIILSSRGIDLLAFTDDKERTDYATSMQGRPLVQQTVITCMESINRDREGPKEISSLVLGTESRQVLFLDPTCTSIEAAITLPSVPTHLAIHGLLAVESRINVACRDGTIYAIKDKQLMSTKIECEALPCGMIRTDSELMVGTIDHKLHSYHIKGKKNWSVALPSAISAMAKVTLTRTDAVSCCAVALDGGEVRIYNGKTCVASLMGPDTITALQYGIYSREANTLVTISRSGALTFKMTKRTATFKTAEAASGPPPEQDIPLAVPKKTRLYVEQTQRERDEAVDMHRVFQRDLCRLRLSAARAFVRTLGDAGSAAASLTGGALRVSASVIGLGPNFKINLDVTNVSQQLAYDVFVFFAYKLEMYYFKQPHAKLPVLVPGVRYQLEFNVAALDVLGRADTVRCFVLKGKTQTPAVTAVISMPMTQPITMT